MNIKRLKLYKYLEFARDIGVISNDFMRSDIDIIIDYWRSLPITRDIDFARYELFSRSKHKNKLLRQVIHSFFEENIEEFASAHFLEYFKKCKTIGKTARIILKTYSKLNYYYNNER